ncbi:MAG: twin-arginine translocation signal domain-containing protein, partial [Chloroflexota bacterium]|nr:twin-arginine translocation signal domain-containing protein [Chloroflexota bacterium]
MSDNEREPFMPSRRQFLKYGAGSALGIGLAASGIPLFRGFTHEVGAAALSVPNLTPGAGIPANPEDRTLVVLQLAGGNDGLNTVIPHTDATYQQLRPTIGQK